MLKKYLFIVLLVGVCFGQSFPPNNGNEFFECHKKAEEMNKLFVMGYVNGAINEREDVFEALLRQNLINAPLAEDDSLIIYVDGYQAIHVDEIRESMGSYSIPKGVYYQQIYDIISKYISENPSIRHESIDYLFEKALSKAFPTKHIKD